MILKKMKKFFIQKKEEEQIFYLMEFFEEKDPVCHIVEQKLMETILMEGSSLNSFKATGFMNNLGWHIGEDGRMYERHAFNEFGMEFHDRVEKHLKKDGKTYITALNEMIDGVESGNFEKEKQEIKTNFEHNCVKKVSRYERKDLELKLPKAEAKTLYQ